MGSVIRWAPELVARNGAAHTRRGFLVPVAAPDGADRAFRPDGRRAIRGAGTAETSHQALWDGRANDGGKPLIGADSLRVDSDADGY